MDNEAVLNIQNLYVKMNGIYGLWFGAYQLIWVKNEAN